MIRFTGGSIVSPPRTCLGMKSNIRESIRQATFLFTRHRHRHTLLPILAVPGVRELLRKRGAPVIAVSPIIGGRALQGSAAKMMEELGREVSARAIAMEFRGLIDGIVIDTADESLAEGIRASGFEVLAAPTFMRNAEDRLVLARAVLEFARAVRAGREAAADA